MQLAGTVNSDEVIPVPTQVAHVLSLYSPNRDNIVSITRHHSGEHTANAEMSLRFTRVIANDIRDKFELYFI